MKEKTITLKKLGYHIKGMATLKLWGGGQGEIQMDSWDIKGKLTKSRLLNGINDGQFGCETILSAEIIVYEMYQSGHLQFFNAIHVNQKHCEQGLRGI